MKESRPKSEKMPGHSPRTQNKRSCKKAALSREGETYQQAAGCETAPKPPFTGRKIIPFPGVKLYEPDSFQMGLDNFLQEVGYID